MLFQCYSRNLLPNPGRTGHQDCGRRADLPLPSLDPLKSNLWSALLVSEHPNERLVCWRFGRAIAGALASAGRAYGVDLARRHRFLLSNWRAAKLLFARAVDRDR